MSDINPSHYAYRVVWSEPDNEYAGLADEFPSLSWLDADQREAFDGIRRLVAEVVADMIGSGEEPPQPKSQRTYSGRFLVRTTPEVHGRLADLAERRHMSLNALVTEKLTEAL